MDVGLYYDSKDTKLLETEVFEHYMALIVEQSGQRQLKTINLRTGKTSVHYFDDPIFEKNKDAQQEFMHVSLEDNLSFKQSEVRYCLERPNAVSKILDFNMGTKKVHFVHQK